MGSGTQFLAKLSRTKASSIHSDINQLPVAWPATIKQSTVEGFVANVDGFVALYGTGLLDRATESVFQGFSCFESFDLADFKQECGVYQQKQVVSCCAMARHVCMHMCLVYIRRAYKLQTEGDMYLIFVLRIHIRVLTWESNVL